MDQVAKGSFDVKLQALAFEGADAESKFGRMTIDKTIAGDLVASTRGQMLSAVTGTKGSAGYVAIEKVVGTLHGKRGSFVLQHSSTMKRGVPTQSIIVVPDSGTEELAGLEGAFTIEIVEGKHFYSFSYRLPAAN